jgi:hypothetical protein
MRRTLLAASLLLAMCASAVQAQQMNRCEDAAGRTVYVDRECDVYGLRHIGAVKDRVMVMPSTNPKNEAASVPADRDQTVRTCRGDAEKFCTGVKPGGGALVDCLLEHQQEMSEECYQALKAKLRPQR